MYYKENLSLRIISLFYFYQCLLCEVTFQNQKGCITVTYCSPRQSYNESEDFLFNLEGTHIDYNSLVYMYGFDQLTV